MKFMNFAVRFSLALGCFVACVHAQTFQKATLSEEKQTILTYPYSDPNPIATLAINGKVAPYYPYFIFDGYANKAVDKAWKVVSLENEFIKLTVLPEVGGKVMGAIEKSTGKEFIYTNHVMKFRAIGIRGPWTSGGIEHNFGLDLGHAPWTAAEVDYVLKKNADGSVSCVVGGLDLASRTQWRVDIRLPKEKAYFETRSLWYNPTPLHDAYLSWEIAAYKATDDLQLYFPGTYHIGHDGGVSPWSVDQEGRNLALYRENNFGANKSYHIAGMFPNWFGGYFHKTHFGSGHWSSYDDAPGKKLWIWSSARSGAIWEDLLTDADGQYVEAQSGIKFNQASPESGFRTPYNQLFMRPFYTETKSDFWFPVKETGGMVDANPNGTLNLVASEGSIKLSFCPNISINDTLTVKSGEKTILSELLQLQPMQVYRKTIPLPEGSAEALRVDIGQNLLSYTSNPDENKIDRPTFTPAGQDFTSAEHLFRQAEDRNSMRNYREALAAYLACLEKEPTHSRALAKVAELYYRQARYEKGLEYARQVLENNTYDPGGNFIYGVLQKALGNRALAMEAFSVATRSMEYRSAAYVQIAGLHLQTKNYTKAKTYAEKALNYNKYNITAYEFLGTAFRKLNQPNEAKKTLELLLEIDPLNHYARFEQHLLAPSAESLSTFTAAIRNELLFETYLELALEYVNQGLVAEAIEVLEQSPDYPTVKYWLAYLYRNTDLAKSKRHLQEAIALSPRLVFPFRLETISVLTWAQQENRSWKTDYYLGLIYWKALRTQKAAELLGRCGDAPDYAPFYIVRGVLFQNDKSKHAAAGQDFKQALKRNPQEWRTWYYLCTYYQNAGAFDQQLEISRQMYALFPGNPAVGIAHAQSLLNANQNEECREVLAEVHVLPAEVANSGHRIYEQANLSLALERIEKKEYEKAMAALNRSKKWPENLGSGAPYQPDNRLQDYLAAHCENQLGNRKSAENYYQQITDYSRKHWDNKENLCNVYISLDVLKAQGKPEEASAAIRSWKIEQDLKRDWGLAAGAASADVQWVLAKYYGQKKRAENLEAEAAANQPANSRFNLFLKAIHLLGDDT